MLIYKRKPDSEPVGIGNVFDIAAMQPILLAEIFKTDAVGWYGSARIKIVGYFHTMGQYTYTYVQRRLLGAYIMLDGVFD